MQMDTSQPFEYPQMQVHQTSNTNLQGGCVCALFGLMGLVPKKIKSQASNVDGHVLIHPLHLNDLNSFF